MLEIYLVKPQTIDRVRACWIGAEVERYAGWLSGQCYSTRTVLRRVPALVAFGECARQRGASVLADMPAHVDGFVAMRIGLGPRRDLGPVSLACVSLDLPRERPEVLRFRSQAQRNRAARPERTMARCAARSWRS